MRVHLPLLSLFAAFSFLASGCGPEVVAGGCASDDDCAANERCLDEKCVGEEPVGCTVDEDGDGYGEGCALGEDCDDTDAALFEEIAGRLDGDGDGTGVGPEVIFCGVLPETHVPVAPEVDCDDGDPTVFREVSLFVDSDGDGVGVGNAQSVVCVGNVDAPPGFTDVAPNPPDCNDNDPTLFREVQLFTDVDGDNVGVGSGILSCIGNAAPSGTTDVRSDTPDCDDGDPSVFAPLSGYRDADDDGVASLLGLSFCTDGQLPAGIVANAPPIGDCDDNDAARRPGGNEFCDGIDNDCNDLIDDEGCPCTIDAGEDKTYLRCDAPLTFVDARSFCGSLPSYSLVTIESDAENSRIDTLRGGGFPWIGLQRVSPTAFRWVDNSDPVFDDFSPGEPNNAGGQENCGQFGNTGWNDQDCNFSNPFICESSQDNRVPTGPCSDADGDGYGINCSQGPDCDEQSPQVFGVLAAYTDSDDDGLTSRSQSLLCTNGPTPPAPFVLQRSAEDDCDDTDDAVGTTCAACRVKVRGDKAYEICTGFRTWPQARQDCRDNQGDMASFEGIGEYIWFTREMYELNANSQLWMGLNDGLTEGVFRWLTSNDPATYGRFRIGEANAADQDCVLFSPNGWTLENCNGQGSHVCEKTR